jgi:hypothetical protein
MGPVRTGWEGTGEDGHGAERPVDWQNQKEEAMRTSTSNGKTNGTKHHPIIVEEGVDTPRSHVQMLRIPVPKIAAVVAVIKGQRGSTLIMRRMSEKGRDDIVNSGDRKSKKVGVRTPKGERVFRSPQEEYEDAFTRDEKGRACIPSDCLRNSLIFACGLIDGIDKKVARSILSVDSLDGTDLIPIIGKPRMRFDIGRTKTWPKKPVPIYRPEWFEWSAQFTIRYSADLIEPGDVLALLAQAGQHSGIGEWRPSSDAGGRHGRFDVEMGGK